MADTGIAAALEREHREIDAGLAAFTDALAAGEWRLASLQSAARALRRHIYVEEEMLFPALRSAGLFGPVAVMLREHGEIWTALDDLERAAEAGHGDDARLVYSRLVALLESHNQKEEVILYPQSELVVEAAVQTRVDDYLRRGVLPAGWRCQAAA